MAACLGTAQVVLDKGQEEDWFAASWIRCFVAISVLALIGFVIRELRARDPIVNLRIFTNRNFAVGVAMIGVLGVVLYGTTAMLPLFLQTLLGYPALESGMAVSPRGFGAMTSAFLVGRLIGIVDSRIMIGLGFVLVAASGLMFSHMNLGIAMHNIVLASILNGAATGLIFVPLSTTRSAACVTSRWLTRRDSTTSCETWGAASGSRSSRRSSRAAPSGTRRSSPRTSLPTTPRTRHGSTGLARR
jgi:DHA2 family multidrug resistance protein